MIAADTIPRLIAAGSKRWPQRDLLVFDERRLSYADADNRSRQLAAKLLAQGIGKGSHVGLLMPNSPDYVISLLAVMRIGAVAVPVSTLATPHELRQQLVHADVTALIMTSQFLNHDYLDKLRQALPAVVDGMPYRMPEAPYFRHVWAWQDASPEWVHAADGDSDLAPLEVLAAAQAQVCAADVGAIIYTSGSTGEPKGVVHSQGNLLRQSMKQAADGDYCEGDRIFTSMPFFWVGGLTYKLLPAMQVGATILGCADGSPAAMLDFIEREKISIFLGWPYSANALQAAPDFSERDLSTLRAGNLYAALPDEVRPPDPTLVVSGLGMTETAGPHTVGQRSWVDASLRGSVGWCAPGVEQRVVDPAATDPHTELPDGELGELWVRGDTLMLGLYKQDSQAVFSADGWYRTRDLVTRRQGHLFFEGRLDDMVKVKGANVSPREVELALMQLDAVVLAAVSGVAGNGSVQLGAVLVTIDDALQIDAVRTHLRESLSAYKIPAVYKLLPARDLPMRSSGKVDRLALIEYLQQAA